MALSPLFAIRGFLAFVAFMEFVNAVRSLFPSVFTLPHERAATNSFIQNKIFSGVDFGDNREVQIIVGQLFGIYSFVNGIILCLVAVYSHFRPLVVLGIITLACKCIFYSVQGFVYGTIPITSVLQVPLLITLFALVGMFCLPWLIEDQSRAYHLAFDTPENEEILSKMRFPKHKRKDL